MSCLNSQHSGLVNRLAGKIVLVVKVAVLHCIQPFRALFILTIPYCW
ncbi:MAG: hypothetical protein ACK4I8_04490 [Armatimonadota bacterium]